LFTKHNVFSETVYFYGIWIFFTKHEKKGRCFFSPKAQKRYVRKVSCIVKTNHTCAKPHLGFHEKKGSIMFFFALCVEAFGLGHLG
jgi:hypothetical protein